jgi:hypothetical protein
MINFMKIMRIFTGLAHELRKRMMLLTGACVPSHVAIILAILGGLEFGRRWLENFVYADTLDPAAFVVSALLTIVLTIVTVSAHALRASGINPADVLKDE